MHAEAREAVEYPTSDGRLMAENTLQYQWITTLKGHLDATLPDFVAGDLLWYPIEGDNKTRRAPDVLVAFGRPKGHRGSYLQWREDGVAPQVVIEVLSPSNTAREMSEKHVFYQTFGVQEYLVIDPESGGLQVGLRQGDPEAPLLMRSINTSYESDRLGLRFVIERERGGASLNVYRLRGERLLTFEELHRDREAQRERADAEAKRAEAEARRAEAEARRAEAEARRADAEEERAGAEARRAQAEARRADLEANRAARLAERLRALGLNPDEI